MKKPTLQEDRQANRIHELESVARVLGERILSLEGTIRERNSAIGILNEELLSLYRRSDLAQIRGDMTALSPLASRCHERFVNEMTDSAQSAAKIAENRTYGVLPKRPRAKKGK